MKEFNPTDLQINLLEIERVFLEVEIRESNSILDALTESSKPQFIGVIQLYDVQGLLQLRSPYSLPKCYNRHNSHYSINRQNSGNF